MDLENHSKGSKPQGTVRQLGANDQKRISVLQASKVESDTLLHQLILGKFEAKFLSKHQEAVHRALGTESALKTDKNQSLAILYSAYVNLRVNSGLTLEEVFTEVSRPQNASFHQAILQNLFEIKLLDLSNCELIELFTFLQQVLTNSHLEICSNWIGLVFSNNIWRVLSKLYMRDLLSTYNGYIDQYAQLSKKQLSPLEKAASEFLPKVVTLFGNKFESLAYNIHQTEIDVCEKILEFLLVSLSTPQSRLATVQLMQDKQFYIKNSMFLRYLTVKEQLDKQTTKNLPEFENLWQSLTLIKRFINYGLEGESKVARRTMMVHYDTFQEFQRLLFHHFGEKVSNYVIKSVGNLDNREKMTEIFSYLDEADLRMIASKLHIFIPEDDDSDPIMSILTAEQKGFKPIIEEILIFNLRATESILNRVRRDPLYPTQRDIWQNPNRIYSHATSKRTRDQQGADLRQTFPVDRITDSFVNIEDYLIRYFYVLKHQSALECRELLEDAVAKVAPHFDPLTGVVKEFAGWSSESLEIKKFTIYEVEKPKIGKKVPERILAEIYYSTVDLMNECKARWEFLREYETLFLLSFNKKIVPDKKEMVNELDGEPLPAKQHEQSYLAKTGLTQVRGARLIAHLDEDRKKINMSEFRSEVHPYGTIRYLQIHLDPNQYSIDTTGSSREKGNSIVDTVFSLVVKRSPEAPNYLNYMNLILKFLESGRDLPNWVNSVVIGKRYLQGMYMPRKPEDSAPIKLVDVFSSQDDQSRVINSIPFLKNHSEDFEFSGNNANPRRGLDWNLNQKQAIAAATYPGLVLVSGCLGTGKTSLVAEMALQNLLNYPEERILIISRCEVGVSLILQSLAKSGKIHEDLLIRLGSYHQVNSSRNSPEVDSEFLGDFTKYGRVNFMLKLRLEMLDKIEKIANDINPNIRGGFTCETAQIFYQSQLLSRFSSFKQEVAKHQAAGTSTDQLPDYPLLPTAIRLEYSQLAHLQDKAGKDWVEHCQAHFDTQIERCFTEMAKTRVLELLRVDKERGNYLVNYHSKVILMTSETLLEKHEELFDLKHPIGTLIIDEAQQITDFESFAALAVAKSLKRVVLLADPLHEPPNIKNPILKEVSGLNKSMIERLRHLGYPEIKLTQQYSYHPSLSTLCKVVYREELSTTGDSSAPGQFGIAGLTKNLQLISLPSSQETSPEETRIQNLPEAELAVALFVFLVLSGQNPQHITILCSEQAQVELIEEIILVKASWHQSLKRPHIVTTFEKYQGQRNRVVIHTFVRTDVEACNRISIGKHKKRYIQALTAGTHATLVLASPSWFSGGHILDTIIQDLNKTDKKAAYKAEPLLVSLHGKPTEVNSADTLYALARQLIVQN